MRRLSALVVRKEEEEDDFSGVLADLRLVGSIGAWKKVLVILHVVDNIDHVCKWANFRTMIVEDVMVKGCLKPFSCADKLRNFHLQLFGFVPTCSEEFAVLLWSTCLVRGPGCVAL